MGRRSILAVVAAVAVLSAVIGWAAGQRIKSPAEIAAEQEPPEPSLITVPVENRVLSQNVVVRGTVKASDATELSVTSAGSGAIITRLPLAPGDPVEEGDVAVEVSGRPMIVLQGNLPVFRNLIPSLEGPDVTQLEEALVRLGLNPGPVDGKYDAATAAAVTTLYRNAGYTPPGDAAADREALTTARDTVADRQAAVNEARKALTAAKAPLKESERLQLDQAVSGAQAALDAAKATSVTARADAVAASAQADSAKLAADAASATAASRLSQAQGGTHPDTGQPPTSTELAELQAEATAKATAATEAATAATAAKAKIDSTAKEQDAQIASAEAALRLAQVQRTEGLAGADVSALQSALSDAEKALTQARADLATAEAKVGAQVPAAELVFLPSLPREVQNVAVEVGDSPTGAVLTISGSETVVESGVSSADRRLLEVGDEALLEEEALGLSIPAIVSFVADQPGGPGLSEDRYAMRLEPTGELPEDALNVNLRISIPISSSGGEVMAVPFAALSAGANGSARVEVERDDGQTELVEVVPGLRAEGYVEIKPSGGGALAAGDRVVVGRDLTLPGSDAESDSDSSDSDTLETDDGGDSGATESTEGSP